MATCEVCGADYTPAMKFCGQCGAATSRACPVCSTPVAAGQRFCGECGSAQPGAAPAARTVATGEDDPGPDRPATPAAERRLCSLLFADLVGFTTLSESRDPEDVRRLLSRYFEAARTVIGRYGGVVEKFIGDAVMAVWGTPVATEGDAERAVRAALDVVDAVAALGAELGASGLVARAGVVTGEVAVSLGAVGEGMVAGDAVNTAARVQTAAPPGAVLVDSTTRRLAAAAVGFDDAGEHTLKGKPEPEQLWRATRVLAMVGGVQRVDGLEAPLVGREAELRTIKELFHACAERRTPRMVTLSGAAGVGKSRLGWEFEKYIDGLASTVWWHRGRCLSYGDGIAFWALAEAVRQRLGIAEEDPTDVAGAKLAAGVGDVIADPTERGYVAVRLGRLLGLPVAGDTGAALAREELFAGWRTFFERLADTAPVAWVVEDAQHADAGLLDFLDHLTDWARGLPIYLLVLARPELEERRPGFGFGRNRTVLTLDPLDATSMDTLVEALVPGMPALARDTITSHAQGMPLFAVETIRSLVDRDVVQPFDGVYRLVGDLGALSVPESLHGLLAARLDALAAPLRALVGDAAVLGSTFPADALVAVSEASETTVRAGLAELLRLEVLEVSADRLSPQRGSYRFAQQLLRQVAYDTLSRPDRKARHLAVAEHLRTTFPDDGEEAADVIANHYRDALAAGTEDPDADAIRSQAIGLSVRAAERALRAGAPTAATASYAVAAELAEEAGMPEAARWWEQGCESAFLAADFAASIGYAERARRLYDATGDARAAAGTQAMAGRALRIVGRHSEAREQLTAAVAQLRAEPDRDTVVALAQLAMLEVVEAAPDAALLAAEALELGQALDVDGGLLAQLLTTSGVMHGYANRQVQAAAAFDYAARLAERAGDTRHQGVALLNLADALAGYDPPAAAAAARIAVELCRRVGNRDHLAYATSNLADVLLSLGEWDQADAVLTTALDDDGLVDLDIVQFLRGRLAALRGDTATTATVLAGLPRFRASEDAQDKACVALAEALGADATGDAERALEWSRVALSYADSLGLHSESVRWAWPLAARTALALGDRAALDELLALLDGHPVGHLSLVVRAERDLARARLAAAGDDPAAAEPLFARAITALREIPAPYHLGMALVDLAEHLLATGGQDGAAKAAGEAAAIAERLGAAPLAARAARLRPRTTPAQRPLADSAAAAPPAAGSSG